MLYRATGKVLCVVHADRGGPVIPALKAIRARRPTEPAPRPYRPDGPPYRPGADAGPHPEPPDRPAPPGPREPFGYQLGNRELARSLRPRPGIDTNPWEHDRAALHELYLLGPRREFGLPQLRRLLSFLEEQRKCR